MNPIERTITIHAAPEAVWNALTEPALMKKWLGDPEMQIEVQADWKVNGEVFISGNHHGKFTTTGKVLEIDPLRKLVYTHLSSVSRLPDLPENHTIYDFTLVPEGDHTRLKLGITNFPTESIYKHLEFYWGTTLLLLKNFTERSEH